MAEYYKLLITKNIILQNRDSNEGQMNVEDAVNLVEIDQAIKQLADRGNGQALFTYGRDLYQNFRIMSQQKNNSKVKKQLRNELEQAHQFLLKSASIDVPTAFFYLGVMAIEGIYPEKNVELGLDYLIRGAAKNNAYCYYYLSLLYHEGKLVKKDPGLEFLYLKRAAEEGFVFMQHNLGQMYYEGRLCRKNDRLALAWLRESARNGYSPSYMLAGDILYEGNINGLPPDRAVEQNRLFALTQYLGAYQAGALFLEAQIRRVIKELIEIEGLSPSVIPKINFVKISGQDKALVEDQARRDEERRKKKQNVA